MRRRRTRSSGWGRSFREVVASQVMLAHINNTLTTTPLTTPFYLDWNFWTATAAFLAIVLSQIPPIHLLLRPRRLEVEVHSRIFVTHHVGNPNMALVLSIRNTGGRELRVGSLSIELSRDGERLGDFPAQNFFESSSSQTPVLFMPFFIKPGGYWAHQVNFLNLFDRGTEKIYRESQSALSADIQSKIATRPKDNDSQPVVAEEHLVAPFLRIFDSRFIWRPGEYILSLAVLAEPGSASYNKRYRFILYESDTAELEKYTNDYKYGDGVSYDTGRHFGLPIPLMKHDS